MIGYLGPSNSFTYVAANSFCSSDRLKPYRSIYELFVALGNKEVVGIVVPIENSIEGSVNLVTDKLLDKDIHINKEIVIDIQLALISNNDDVSKIKHILSHPHALAQCRNTLNNNKIVYNEIQTGSTSQAVKDLKTLDNTYAAIASKNTVDGTLSVLLDDIGDNHNNKTRFIYVSNSLVVKPSHNKSSIISAANNDISGALYDILHEFAIRGINLTKIESRPSKDYLGSYVFHIDFVGNVENPDIMETLSILKHKTRFLKVLGSYNSAT